MLILKRRCNFNQGKEGCQYNIPGSVVTVWHMAMIEDHLMEREGPPRTYL